MNIIKLANELLDAGLEICGVDEYGKVSWLDGHPVGADEANAEAIISAHDPTDLDEAIKPQIINAVKDLVGVAITDMALAQLKLLLFALAYKAGAIEPSDLTIKPLSKWIR